jgi:hypothetical protein
LVGGLSFANAGKLKNRWATANMTMNIGNFIVPDARSKGNASHDLRETIEKPGEMINLAPNHFITAVHCRGLCTNWDVSNCAAVVIRGLKANDDVHFYVTGVAFIGPKPRQAID